MRHNDSSKPTGDVAKSNNCLLSLTVLYKPNRHTQLKKCQTVTICWDFIFSFLWEVVLKKGQWIGLFSIFLNKNNFLAFLFEKSDTSLSIKHSCVSYYIGQ